MGPGNMMVPALLIVAALVAATNLASSEEIIPDQSNPRPGAARSGPLVRKREYFIKFTVTPPEHATFTAYGNATLSCVAGGSPAPHVYWVRNQFRLVPFELPPEIDKFPEINQTDFKHLGIGNTRGVLHFDCIRPEDAGLYACFAENSYEVIAGLTNVTVIVPEDNAAPCNSPMTHFHFPAAPPRIVMWSTDRIEFWGNDVRLFCRADGKPKPAINWYTIGDDVALLPASSAKYRIHETGDLIVRNLTWEDHVDYFCVASNLHGMDRSETFLYPSERPKSTPRRTRLHPLFTGLRAVKESLRFYSEPLRTVNFTAYRNASLECVAGGSPPPTVYWTKEGVRVSEADVRETIHTLEKNNETTLWIASTKAKVNFDCVTPEDSGIYHCVAENGYEVRRTTTIVNVIPNDDRVESCASGSRQAPEIVMWTGTRFEYNERHVRLYCRAHGDPAPSIEWYEVKQRDVLLPQSSEKYQVLSNGDLMIRDVQWESTADYACVASNIHGTDRVDVFLHAISH